MQYKVEKLDDFGRGIIKVNEKVCFVPNCLPSETIDVEIIKEKKKYLEGKAIKIYEESKDRIAPKCKYFDKCGGCQLQHLSLEEENKYKIQKVENIIKKFANKNISINKIYSPNEYNYRNKITLRVKNNKIGLLENNSDNFVEIDECLLVQSKINETIKKLKEIIKEENNISKIMIRVSNDDKNVMLKITGTVNNLDEFLKISDSLIINDKVIKEKYIISQILNKKFYVSSESFFQINKEVVEQLYSKVVEVIKEKKSKKVLDLYCGVGSIGICISDYAEEVFGIEIVEEAINAAKKNKELNNVNNINFKCGKVEDVINKENIFGFDTVIVDPPRSGIDQSAVNILNNSNIDNIIYVSCDPITLARDIKLLDNYNVKKIELFNMFPRTYHCESVCILERR